MLNQIPVSNQNKQNWKLIRLIILLGLLALLGLILFAVLPEGKERGIPDNPEPTIFSKPSPVSTCGPCPQYAPPPSGYCHNGHLIPQRKTSCGCQLPPRCVTSSAEAPPIVIQKIDGKCQTKEKQKFTITQQGKRVLFSGTITDVSPCDNYSAFSSLAENPTGKNGKTLTIYLQNEGSTKNCIECVGAIEIKGESGDLPSEIVLIKIVLVEKGGEVVLTEKALN